MSTPNENNINFTPELPKTRNAYWDTIKGFLIILVVLGHFFYSYRSMDGIYDLVYCIYVFHMPVFVFVTGYFSKSINSRSSHALLKLLAAYLIFNFSMMLFNFYLNGITFNFSFPYYSFWYILAVIAWRLLAERLSKNKFILPITICIAIVIGFVGISNDFALARIIVFLPFFMAGYLLKRERIDNFIQKRKIKTQVLGIIVILVSIIAAWFFINFSSVTISTFTMIAYKNYNDLISRVIIFALAALITLGILMSFPKRPIPLITKWGKNSLSIFLLHRFLTLIFVKLLPPAEADIILIWVLAFVCTIATLFLLGNDWISGGVNNFLDTSANILIGKRNTEQSKKEKIFELITKISFVMIVIIIIVQSIIGM